LRDIINDSDKLDILIKIFINLKGLAIALIKNNKLKDINQLRIFITDFSSRLMFFDFIDIKAGKERTDYKIRNRDI